MPGRRIRKKRRTRLGWRWSLLGALLAALLFFYIMGRLMDSPGSRYVFPFSIRRNTELIDRSQKPALQGEPGWEYQREMQVDLDGDGADEKIVVIARVTAVPGRPGEYQWDDGQLWQVYVQDGRDVTRIYSRFVQLGHLQVFTTDEKRPRLAIAESQGAVFALYTVAYAGPGKVHVSQLANLSVLHRAW